jgi:hypothetical protein
MRKQPLIELLSDTENGRSFELRGLHELHGTHGKNPGLHVDTGLERPGQRKRHRGLRLVLLHRRAGEGQAHLRRARRSAPPADHQRRPATTFVRQHSGGNPPVRRLRVQTIGGETAAVSSIAITGDIYGHTSDATTRAAIDGLSDALGLS